MVHTSEYIWSLIKESFLNKFPTKFIETFGLDLELTTYHHQMHLQM